MAILQDRHLSLKLRRQGSGETTDVHQLAAVLAGEIPSQSEVLGPASQEVISESSSTLVKLVNTVIADAIERTASDIHIESDGPHTAVRIRFRIDGLLVPLWNCRPITARPWWRASRSCRIWASPSGKNPRTARSTSRGLATCLWSCAW
ncbi:MAG: hypothetical protein ACK4K3_10700 [Aquabacterium sp.]